MAAPAKLQGELKAGWKQRHLRDSDAGGEARRGPTGPKPLGTEGRAEQPFLAVRCRRCPPAQAPDT